jgi:hypothetical protein
MRKINVIAFVGAAALGSAVAFVPRADAGSRLYHAASCASPSQNVLTYSGPNAAQGQVQNNSSQAVHLLCPVLHGTDFPPSANNAVVVSGYGHGNVPNQFQGDVALQACVTFAHGAGGACGAQKLTTNTPGAFQLPVDTSKWPKAASTDFLYVDVSLGAAINGSDDVLFGYQVND